MPLIKYVMVIQRSNQFIYSLTNTNSHNTEPEKISHNKMTFEKSKTSR